VCLRRREMVKEVAASCKQTFAAWKKWRAVSNAGHSCEICSRDRRPARSLCFLSTFVARQVSIVHIKSCYSGWYCSRSRSQHMTESARNVPNPRKQYSEILIGSTMKRKFEVSEVIKKSWGERGGFEERNSRKLGEIQRRIKHRGRAKERLWFSYRHW
jgi:hypothetical protein